MRDSSESPVRGDGLRRARMLTALVAATSGAAAAGIAVALAVGHDASATTSDLPQDGQGEFVDSASPSPTITPTLIPSPGPVSPQFVTPATPTAELAPTAEPVVSPAPAPTLTPKPPVKRRVIKQGAGPPQTTTNGS